MLLNASTFVIFLSTGNGRIMSSRSSFLHLSLTLPGIPPRSSLFFKGAWSFGARDKRVNFDSVLGCRATSKPRSRDVFQNGLPVLKWPEIVEDDIEGPEALKVSTTNYGIKERVNSIKMILTSMEDGEISISAYDTAWVSLVQDVRGSGLPQFPSSLQWIANNQLSDGSWGDSDIFLSYDRIINTLACVVALKSWTMHPEKCEKGIRFLRETISKLEGENAEHMPIGFEVAFPSLLEIARSLNIEVVPDDSQVLQDIYAKRNIKLTRIPRDIMHRVPTTLLHSLEGMPGLHWEKLLHLQSKDGSFLFSPSSTAFALTQTKDDNCLKYLKNAVLKFNGGVPNVYPVDLFEHIWVVDRLQRLGISRYFQPEIKGCVNYVYRYWTDKGICWARNSEVSDIDDTAMGFRILRLHGHEVSADVFQHFEKGGEFFCFAGQSTQAVTGMFNLYRASQVLFPGEKILEDAKQFSSNFLREKQASNELFDKWIIMKDLPSEVGYALEVPWYASLPRVETRFYVEQYGAEDDVWIGKTLYRMPYVNNNTYLELAKQDYNNCQASHLMEWDSIQKWYSERNLEDLGLSRRTLLFAYFLAAASIFESERSNERIAWVKTAALIEAITSHFQEKESRRAFLFEFRNHSSNRRNYINGRTSNANQTVQELVRTLLETLNHLSLEAIISNGQDISHHLRQAWEKWMLKWQSEGDRHQGKAELLAHIINLTACCSVPKELLSHPQYKRLSDLLNRVYYKLCSHQRHKVHDNGNHTSHANSITSPEIESGMQELVKLVLHNSSDDIDSDIKQTFLALAKSFYYAAYCDHGTINLHIAKVLFERVV